jgi:drug/metabolite transporter (DMT)-like permease
MQPTSLALLLVAALLHASINVLMKKARDKLAFTWWLLTTSAVLGAPFLLLGLPRDATGWGLVVASGLLEAAYFVTLSRAYSLGDLSQVYPLARGSAPLFIAAWAGLFLGERPSAVGVCGIVTVVLGLYLINLPSLRDWSRPLSGFKEPAARWALLTGVLISGYTTIDKRGVAHAEPLPYLVLFLMVAWITLSVQWLIPGRRRALLEEIAPAKGRNVHGDRLAIVLGSVFGNAAYVLVLTAMKIDNVSYIGAVREVSVVFGAWMGVQFFGERGGNSRIVAAALVVLGMFLIAVKG